MRIPKRYGQSRIDKCPFCDKQASQQNKQGIPVCVTHRDRQLDDLKCLCGEFLEVRNGKYGVFFSCANCGNMNMRKALEINDGNKRKQSVKIKKEPRETIIRSDDPLYFN